MSQSKRMQPKKAQKKVAQRMQSKKAQKKTAAKMHASGPVEAPYVSISQPDFYRSTLPNGSKFLAKKGTRDPNLNVTVGLPMGIAHGRRGLSHTLEHMLFREEKTTGSVVTRGDIERDISWIGGNTNANTHSSLMWFYAEGPHSEKGYKLYVDFLQQLIGRPQFTKRDLKQEKGILRTESTMMKKEDAENRADQLIIEAMYKKPLSQDEQSSHKEINATTRGELLKHWETYFHPRNLIFVAAGDFDFKKIERRIAKAMRLHPLADRPYNGPIKAPKVKQKLRHIKEKSKHVDQAHLIFGYPGPSLGEPGNAALHTFDLYMSAQEVSPVYRRIRSELGLAYNIDGGVDDGQGYSYQQTYIPTNVNEVRKVRKEMDRIVRAASKIDAKEFRRFKELHINKIKLRETLNESTASNMLRREAFGLGGDHYFGDMDRVKATKVSEFRAIAQNILDNGHASAVVLPK